MNNFIRTSVLCYVACLNVTLWTTPSFAGQMYIYKDEQGSTLLTNKQSSDRSLQKVKVTYYPDSNIHSYSNWGKSEASVLPSYSRNKNTYDHIIRQAAATHGVSEGLIKAVIHTESGFNPYARSPVGAQGLMQLMPATARRFNVNNPYDPQQNIMAGAKYLAWLLKRFNNSTRLALAGYNAGEGNVQKYGDVPPFRETQDYVRRVSSRYSNLYANGVGLSSSNTTNSTTSTSQPQVIAQSNNYNTSNENTTVTKPQYSQRQIIVASGNSFTDAPAGTYTTNNASATAKIYISN
ncbi:MULTISPECIES: lytic transglycosylase domain-containing protein [unclassified Acinetobacter]|uniref:lytic transglycosylase domain-containing protein n=1 Tax=unclassified Acinetobacter TaxID=196816 RepID=UPI00257596A1|nr:MULTISPECIES: lytic transglycosylase domain-containing protein [unclassified Acinetobacter]MDM1757376.1 lytic transglycosylase domain-containing protein [Acinetobacter sp. 256-1]MDM1760368.1 lytic transglycosylase domain-containing protein [Acinetobacter sp. 251-1]